MRKKQQGVGPGGLPESNEEWEHWRTEALRFLRERIERPEQTFSDDQIRVDNIRQPRGDRSLLVEVLLWECSYDEAWGEAITGGCSAALRVEYKRKRNFVQMLDSMRLNGKSTGY